MLVGCDKNACLKPAKTAFHKLKMTKFSSRGSAPHPAGAAAPAGKAPPKGCINMGTCTPDPDLSPVFAPMCVLCGGGAGAGGVVAGVGGWGGETCAHALCLSHSCENHSKCEKIVKFRFAGLRPAPRWGAWGGETCALCLM